MAEAAAAALATTAYVVEIHAPIDGTLHVLSHAPSDVVEESTCVVLSQNRHASSEPSGHDKTMLYFSLDKERVGSLADALQILTRHGINLQVRLASSASPPLLPLAPMLTTASYSACRASRATWTRATRRASTSW